MTLILCLILIRFQFLNGAIGASVNLLFVHACFIFQFLNGAIGALRRVGQYCYAPTQFQFLNGAIGAA